MIGKIKKASRKDKLKIYYIIDVIVKQMDKSFYYYLEEDLQRLFSEDLIDSFNSNTLDLVKKFIFVFLTWENSFSTEFMEFVVNNFYKKCI